jgi:hypothetical protein
MRSSIWERLQRPFLREARMIAQLDMQLFRPKEWTAVIEEDKCQP